MKAVAVCSGIFFAISLCAHGAVIPDGLGGARFEGGVGGWNPGTFDNQGEITTSGLSSTVEVTGMPGQITEVDIFININTSQGVNGDLYAYLQFGGFSVPLINRVGRGTGGDGVSREGYQDSSPIFSFRLSDRNSLDIHFYRNLLTSSPDGAHMQPDGRNISPTSTPAEFDAAGSSRVGLSLFNGLQANGTWTLYLADISSDNASVIQNWDMAIITAVPEPVNVALSVFGGVALLGLVTRRRLLKRVPGR